MFTKLQQEINFQIKLLTHKLTKFTKYNGIYGNIFTKITE